MTILGFHLVKERFAAGVDFLRGPTNFQPDEKQEAYQEDGTLDVKIEWKLLQIKYSEEINDD